MDAIILVGGQGTRLRPLTATTPKPMLAVAGVPFVTHQLARLREAGVDHVVLATAYRSEVFAAHFGDGSGVGLDLDYVHEQEALGTGGAIRNVAGLLRAGPDEPVVVLNGDVLAGHDLAVQLRLHRDTGADVTLYLTEVDDARAFGAVPLDAEGRVLDFCEKMERPVTNRVNAGCYVFTRRVVDEIPAGQVVSVERETFPGLLAAGRRLWGFVDTGYWLDLGTPAAYVRGSCDLVLGRVPSPALPGPVGERLLLPGARVAPDARVDGGTAVGERAVVAAGAEVSGSVLLDGAEVGEGARVTASVVGAGAVVGPGCVLDGVVVGDGARLGAGNELLAGARVWPGVELAAGAVRFSSDR